MSYRVYALPACLFAILTVLFVCAGMYLHKEQQQVRVSKAQSVSEQVKISLQVFSNEREKALLNLMQNWPSFEPNTVDWFNAQAVSLMQVQSGISAMVFVDEDGRIKWVAEASNGVSPHYKRSLTGQSSHALSLPFSLTSDVLHSALVSVPSTQQYFIVSGRIISPQEPQHGAVVASYDVYTILSVMLGELVGPQFVFRISDGEHILFSSGQFVNDDTAVSTDVFHFIGRPWQLTMQSKVSRFHPGWIVSGVGVLMSLLFSWVLHKHLKGAFNLGISQQRYKTASDASLDALLIYEPTGNDFRLVEANRYSFRLFKGQLAKLRRLYLSEQLSLLVDDVRVEHAQRVVLEGKPFEHYCRVNSGHIHAHWIKLQMVKAGNNLALTVRDVSERFNAQVALQQSEEKYRRLVDTMRGHFVYTKNAQHQFTYVSAGIEKILGLTPEVFCDKASQIVYEIPENWARIKREIETGRKPEPYLMRFMGSRNQLAVIELADSPVLDDNLQLVGVEGIARDVTQEYALQREVAYQANHDQLTGLLNRYAFDRALQALLEDNTVGGSKGVMCFIDMDRFKLVNDACGHPAGDKLLKEVAELFRKHVESSDLLARIGGDEFCIIFKHASLCEVKRRLDSLLQAVSEYRFVYDGKVFFIGASIGVIEIDDPSLSAAMLIKAADNACYKAKFAGRNRYVVYRDPNQELEENTNESNVLQTVQQAIENNSFVLFSQAIVPLTAAQTQSHIEILLRLADSSGNMISPALFIPLAERHGLMNKVDWWVFEHTLLALEQHPHYLNYIDKISLNLSGTTLGDDLILGKMVERLIRSSVPPHKLCFEITETTAVTNIKAAKLFMQTLKSLGCRFALDDFGAGMSSFTYLKNLDVDFVKIDGSFVRNMVNDDIDYETVRAINSIAHSMGKQTVAEFVADAETLSALTRLNVDFGQGFALDKPIALSTRIHGALDPERCVASAG